MKSLAFVLVAAGLLAAVALAAAAEGDAIAVDLKTFKFKVADDLQALFGYDDNEAKLFYYTGGAAETTIKIPADGEYELVVKASCDPAQGERAKFKVTLGEAAVGMETLLSDDGAKEYKLTGKAKAGEQKLAIEYTNDVYKEGEYDRNFYVHGVSVKPVK
ncbi:MAG: carbohydrate-binding domain-containing protein [Pirellulaceae bacterium]